jgi:hypothetical protein
MVAMVLAHCARPPHSPRCRARHVRLSPDFHRGGAVVSAARMGRHSTLDIPVGGMFP